jgi:Na+/H+-dicarboxylate symporter/ABC-type amino acid transport substrate-binding protein
MIFLWVVALAVIAVFSLGLPDWEAGTFFSSSIVETPEPFDFLSLYLPVNPFNALANNIVPASVLFSILLGVGLIGLRDKERLLVPLEVLEQALTSIANFVISLTPWGTFALTAYAAGTLVPSELLKLQGYIWLYTAAAFVLAFVVLPGLVAALTPFRYRALVSDQRESVLTAFATGKLFAVLPMVIDSIKKQLTEHGVSEEEASSTAGVFVPLAYPFPQSGKLLGLLFLPFAAWLAGTPLTAQQLPQLLAVGLVTFFGSPIAAVPFLLDLLRLPRDLFPLFLVAGVWTIRLGDMVGAVHLSSFTLLTAAWNRGWLRIRPGRLGLLLCATVALTGASILATRTLVRRSLAGQDPPSSLVASMTLEPPLKVEVAPPAPNPSPLRDAQTHLQRIQETGVLRIGYRRDSAPFCYTNEPGDLVGFDIDLIRRFARDLEADLKMVPYDVESLDAGFAEDRFDLAVGGLPSSMNMLGGHVESHPYLHLHTALVVRDDRVDEFETLFQLHKATEKNLRIGVVSNGYLADIRSARFPGLEVVQLPSREAFVSGDGPALDALLTTAESGAVLSMMYPEFAIVVPRGASTRIPTIFAVHPDALALRPLLDRWIELMRSLGTIDELYRKWILGEVPAGSTRRWSVVRDVLGWQR